MQLFLYLFFPRVYGIVISERCMGIIILGVICGGHHILFLSYRVTLFYSPCLIFYFFTLEMRFCSEGRARMGACIFILCAIFIKLLPLFLPSHWLTGVPTCADISQYQHSLELSEPLMTSSLQEGRGRVGGTGTHQVVQIWFQIHRPGL